MYVSLAESPAVPKAIAELTPFAEGIEYEERMELLEDVTYPKPLVEFANKPMIQHQIEALADAGVTDVVLAVNYRPEIMAEALKTVSIPVQL